VSERLKKNSGLKVDSVLNDRRGGTIPVAVLLVFVVLLSAGSGMYAGASFFAQQAPNVTVTTTIYTTTTSWTTSTLWSTLTETVEGILTTIEYTTSTSTITVTTSSSSSTTTSTRKGTTVTITQVTGAAGTVTVKGYLKDKNGIGLQGLQVRITVDGGYQGRVTTTSGGAFSYTGPGPTIRGTHYATVWFDGNSQYTASSATRSYTF